ncbi:MAG: hypothetical protein E2591_26760 [Achromobacter sp.]|uniref:hypothetical protein n=1 Tax=Achromobacter sp. TaxID=134375 RepID=UPI0012CBDE74|nr:hypothetical protein [Achromobacter sp.]MPS81680.1 hypothetical protein [Achromobacter sp.]
MSTTAIVLIVFLIVLQILFLIACTMKRDSIESAILHFISMVWRNDAEGAISLVSTFDDKTLITKSRDLVSYIRIEGRGRYIGVEEFDALAEKLEVALEHVLGPGAARQHRIVVGFRSDPEGAPDVLKKAFQPALATARRMGAGERMKVWLERKGRALSGVIVDESIVLGLFTLRSGLSADEAERAADEIAKVKAGLGRDAIRGANSQFSQNAIGVPPLMAMRHEAAMTTLMKNLTDHESGIGLIGDVMPSSETLPVLRSFLDGRSAPEGWTPALLGGKGGAATAGARSTDAADLLPLGLGRQLLTAPSIEFFKDYEGVTREGTTHVGFSLDVFPAEDPAPGFNVLARSVSDVGSSDGSRLPYAASFELYPDGERYKKASSTMAAFLGGMGDYNRSIKHAWDHLRAHRSKAVALRGVFTTWSHKSESEAFARASQLKSKVQNWGGSTVSNESGAPAELCLAAAPGVASRSPIPFVPTPLAAAVRALPVFRAASPWRIGELLLRTEFGKLFPIAFGSTLQANTGGCVIAPPGRGKSLLLNSLNFSVAMGPGLQDLPYITITDFGMSSALNIALLRSILPAHKRHQAVSVRVRNEPKYASNPFDTQLGFDRPTERERDFQRFVIAAMAPNLGPESGKFIGAVIDAVFELFSRNSPEVKRWQRANHPEMTRVMDDLGLKSEGRRVYDLVDELFDHGKVHEAVVVQRYAVPVLYDLITAARSQSVRDQYDRPGEPTPTPSGESILAVFTRAIGAAAADYALLSTVTQFDLDDARVVAIDLEELVSGGEDEESRRRAAVMMMFGRNVGARNYFLRWDELATTCPPRYLRYHETRVREIYTSPKFLEYDEFHFAKGVGPLLELIDSDYRTGRKYQVFPFLVTQQFSDVPPAMLKSMASVFILGAGSEEEGREVQEAFNLTDSERRCIMTKCLGPTAKGSPIFAVFKTVKGVVSQLLYHTASPLELWAFNSSAIDAAVRAETTKQLGGDYWQALLALTDQLPSGSARTLIEARKLRMGEDEAVEDGGLTVTVGREIAARALEKLAA